MKNQFAVELAKLSWEKRKSPQEYQRLKEISKLGVKARQDKKISLKLTIDNQA
jgi:hypothetical protein